MTKRTYLVAIAAALLITGCSSSGSTAHKRAGSPTAVSTSVPQKPVAYVAAKCPMKLPDTKIKVDCGWLTVPEDRNVANSPSIELAVARLHSNDPNAGAPVVDLGGGPGFPALTNVDSLVKSTILDHHDLIVWDQRGIGYSKPSLVCPEYEQAVFDMLNSTDAPAVEGQRIDASVQQCHTRLVTSHINLNGFNTLENAADLAALRVALKIPEWNLHAASYGTAVGITEIEHFPAGIRSVLLDSVVQPDATVGALDRVKSAQRSFDVLYQTCASQPSCHDKYGDLEVLVAKAAASLTANPEKVTVTDPASGRTHPMTITGDDLYAGLFQAMYSPSLIAAIPSVMQAIASGDRSIIPTLAAQAVPLATGSSTGMMLSVDCADRQRLLQPAALTTYLAAHPQLGTIAYLSAAEDQCKGWNVNSAPASFNKLPGPTKIPVLVTAGAFDPITPPAGTKRVAKALGAPYLFFPDAGHGAVGPSTCSVDIWNAFMADPHDKLDTSCMKSLSTIKLS